MMAAIMMGISCLLQKRGYRLRLHFMWIWLIIAIGAPLLKGQNMPWAALLIAGIIVLLLRYPLFTEPCEAVFTDLFAWWHTIDPDVGLEIPHLDPIEAEILGYLISCGIGGASSLTSPETSFGSLLVAYATVGITLGAASCFSKSQAVRKLFHWWAILIGYCASVWYMCDYCPYGIVLAFVATMSHMMFACGLQIRREDR